MADYILMPTDKQVSYATAISEGLEVPLPKEYTRQAYSNFISEYKEEYQIFCNECKEMNMLQWIDGEILNG